METSGNWPNNILPGGAAGRPSGAARPAACLDKTEVVARCGGRGRGGTAGGGPRWGNGGGKKGSNVKSLLIVVWH